MDGERSNIFDCFGDENVTYTELQPIQVNSLSESENGSDLQEMPYLHTTNAQQPDEDNTSDDSFPQDSQMENPDADDNYSHAVRQQVNWIPDNDCSDEEFIPSSDESSDEDEYPDLLVESDPEPEIEPDHEDTNFHPSVPLPASSNITLSKNGSVVWSRIPISQVGRTPTRNVFRPPRSNVRYPNIIDTVASAFFLIFTVQILDDIMKMTNQEGVRRKGARWEPVDMLELKALLGLFIHFGARKLSLLRVNKIWYGAAADSVAKCTMSMRRFIELTTMLRFDDKGTRSARRNQDIFAPLRDLFSAINKNLQRHYIPSQCLTVDEQLVPWRGRCKFLQYLPSKPDKYGLKLFMICDNETSYPLQAIPYLGKHGERKVNLGRETVKELATPYHKTGRNITCDNFFTDLELANHLSKKGLSLVGTVRKNKAFLPQEFQTATDIKKFESRFLFTDKESLVAYKSNDKKHVVVMSTMHHAADVDDEGKRKPVIVKYYNKTKGGVDTFDFMCHSFSCKRKTRRWPMVLFYNLLDTAAVATHIIYKKVFPSDTRVHKDRGHFNETLAKELLLEHLMRRMEIAKTTRRVNLSFEILKLEWAISQPTRGNGNAIIRDANAGESRPNKRKGDQVQGRCCRCPRKKDRKVKQTCSKCDNFVCNEHSSLVCCVCRTV